MSKTKYLVAALILILTAVIVAAVLVNNASSPKWKVSEYFSIVPVGATGWNYTTNSMVIKTLFFSITPVIGDAHDLFIYYRGATETITETPYKTVLLKGETWSPEPIQFSNYIVPVNATGYLKFTGVITPSSQEAGPESVTLYLHRDNVTILPGQPPIA